MQEGRGDTIHTGRQWAVNVCVCGLVSTQNQTRTEILSCGVSVSPGHTSNMLATSCDLFEGGIHSQDTHWDYSMDNCSGLPSSVLRYTLGLQYGQLSGVAIKCLEMSY